MCTVSFQEVFQEFATVAFVEFVKGDTEVSAVLQHERYRQTDCYAIPSYIVPSYIVPSYETQCPQLWLTL